MTDIEARELIEEADSTYTGRNVTRWYSVVFPIKNGEAEVWTYAVKTWQGKPLIMLASVFYTDPNCENFNSVSGRCIINNFMNTKHFNWIGYGGRPHQNVWEDVDGLADEMLEAYPHSFMKHHEFFGLGEFLNDFTGTKYQYGCFEKSYLRVSDWIDLMHETPKTELVIKAKLYKWLDIRYIKLLEDRGLTKFVMKNYDSFKYVSPYRIIQLYRKYGNEINTEEISAKILCDKFKFTGLAFKPLEIYTWLKTNNVQPEELKAHIAKLRELNMDLDYRPHVLPKDFALYSLQIAQRLDALHEEQRKQKEREEKLLVQTLKKARIKARKQFNTWLKSACFKDYEFILPKGDKELMAEGKAMENCIGRIYTEEKLIRNREYIGFIHKGGQPYIDLRASQKGTVLEARYSHNRPVEQDSEDYTLCTAFAEQLKTA